ncbi:hypothetical protein HGO38_05255 [Rhizobium sp. CG5]|uniref:hypothetical protein n=1 Tax=Rhizobium sp. CG5 TaxID=2726076 RepID=UPI0020347F5E|nr:hypothetical protein [Rhizobium sp. CG5]MCM2472884.1 hypothetical protein [Rhizobium sp. CG5]
MIDFDSKTLSALTFLTGCVAEWRVQIQLLQKSNTIAGLNHSLDVRAKFIKSLHVVNVAADTLEMRGVAIAAKRAAEECSDLFATPIGHDSHRLNRIVTNAEHVILAFMNELEGCSLFTISPRHAQLYSEPFPFGEAVDAAFPSASYDIAEAAKCLALSRWTASVMHSMRVLELGLTMLGRHYSIEETANWNTRLNQIEAASRDIRKRVHGADEEQWAAEAAIHLRFVKNAWRNHAMHGFEKYDGERSFTIFENTRAFMQQLCKKLEE